MAEIWTLIYVFQHINQKNEVMLEEEMNGEKSTNCHEKGGKTRKTRRRGQNDR